MRLSPFHSLVIFSRRYGYERVKKLFDWVLLELEMGGRFMLQAAITFFVLALLAMLLGASGFAGISMEIGRTLLFVFLVLAIISFIASMVTGRRTKNLP
jgi:uncharacterized membrane protein YtjA (UPF0391 family)